MKKLTLLAVLLLAFAPHAMRAQQSDLQRVTVDFNTRFDYLYEKPDAGESCSGFHGRYLNLMVFGDITDKLSYNIRQRLNKRIEDSDVFSATDWVYISYRPNAHWELSGGKQVVAIGGYEYDAAPIDIYYSSMFWQNIACYAFGVSGKYISGSGRHSLMGQVCNSPYQKTGSSCYAYNLMWNGSMGAWQTIWSVNGIETERGKYACYIALGNRFDFKPVSLELDLMQRSYEGHQFWLDDYSVIAKLQWDICPYVSVFAKGGYERFHPNRMGTDGLMVEKPFYGAGVESRPFKSYRNLRLHAMWNVNNGAGGAASLETTQFLAGATWRCNIFKSNKK